MPSASYGDCPRPNADDASNEQVREGLHASAREIAAVAEDIRKISARTTTSLFHPVLTASAARSPQTGMRMQWDLLRVLTSRDGLGAAITADRGVARRLGQAGGMLGGDSLAALVAVSSLCARIDAVLTGHPELRQDPGIWRLINSVTGDRGLSSARALRTLFEDRGARRALADIAPIAAELLAIHAMLDENPHNDEVGYAMVAGRAIETDPLTGVASARLCKFDEGEGDAVRVALTDWESSNIAATGSLLGFLGNVDVLTTNGRIILHDVEGADGVVRHVLLAPGMAPGKPRNDSPQDFVGAWRNLFMDDSPYVRAILRAIDDYGIPTGSEICLVGHSEGGIAVMNLAQSEEFSSRFCITHVVAVGSPVDSKTPADPHTWVASITNQHDIVPMLDGRGAGTSVNPHPHWYEVDYVGSSHEFPVCHQIRAYVDDLRTVIADARRDIDAALAPYCGNILRTQTYKLTDRVHPPQGYPLLTVPTSPVVTSAGPGEIPVRYYDSSTAVAFFTVGVDAANQLLPDVPWIRPSRLGRRRALVALSMYEHRCTSMGPHNEISLSVLVDDLWRPTARDIALDLVRRGDLRRTGRYVIDLSVSSAEACAMANEVWGQPATLTSAAIRVEILKRSIHVSTQVPDGDLQLEVHGSLGPSFRCPELDWALYGRSGESTVRTLVRATGRLRIHPAPRLRLRLNETVSDKLVQHLNSLGLNGARPSFVLSCPDYMAYRSAGAILPR